MTFISKQKYRWTLVRMLLSLAVILPLGIGFTHSVSAANVYPSTTDDISYGVEVTADAANNNGVRYVLTNVDVSASSLGYKSLTIIPPSEFTAHYSLPAGWNEFVSGSIINFIIPAPLTNGMPTTLVSFLESNLYFTLTTENVFPTTAVPLTVNVSENFLSSRVDADGVVHYYEFVPDDVINWLNAYNAAKTRSFNGLTGYLATITSQGEQDFIYDSIAKEGGWLGGTRLRNKTTNTLLNDENVISTNIADFEYAVGIANSWYWSNGPEAGTVFFQGVTAATGSSVPGQYVNWTPPSEPNNSFTGGLPEYVTQFAYSGSQWNDLPYNPNNFAIKGYYVEYGGYSGEQRLQDHAGFQAPFPAPVTVQFLRLNSTALFSESYLFGNIGVNYTAPDASPAPSGYAYLGLDSSSAPKTGLFSDEPQTVIHRYAPVFQVDFNLNYTGSVQPPVSQQVPETTFVQSVTNPQRIGYRFTGWNTAADGSGSAWDFASSQMPGQNLTLFAQWTAENFQLSFDLNGATGTVPQTQSIPFGSKATAVPDPVREGWIFAGWWYSTGSATDTQWDFNTNTMPAENITLKAVWTQIAGPLTYNLRFDLNGGKGQVPEVQVLQVGQTAVSVSNPTRDGYTFTGWNTVKDGKGTTWNFTTDTMPRNYVTLYAQWKALVVPKSGEIANPTLAWGLMLLSGAGLCLLINQKRKAQRQ